MYGIFFQTPPIKRVSCSSLNECIAEIKKNSRRYAKRQLTWFKSIQNSKWITPDYNFEEVVEYINDLINN